MLCAHNCRYLEESEQRLLNISEVHYVNSEKMVKPLTCNAFIWLVFAAKCLFSSRRL